MRFTIPALILASAASCNSTPPVVSPTANCDDPNSVVCNDAAGGCCPPNYGCVAPDLCEFAGPTPIDDLKKPQRFKRSPF